jgi:CsoR family transcriptional regulator, copper-sensing transcriptional repressor
VVKKNFVKDVSNRLSRCEGHLRSVRNMIAEEKSCEALFIQLAAIKAALNQVSLKVYENHIDECLSDKKANLSKENRELKFISRLMLQGKT